MKRFKCFWMLTMLMVSTSVSAYDVEIDGICYNYINDNTELEVTYYSTNPPANAPYYKGSIVIPDSVTILNRTRKVTRIREYAFKSCHDLASVTIPNSVTSIGSEAFRDCNRLTSVTIGSSVTRIGSSAFYDCSGLSKVIVKDIAAWCGISFPDIDSNPLYYAKHLYSDNDTEITDLAIPDGVTGIGSYAFYNCSGLTSVTIPNSVASIGSYAFYNCSGLTSVTIPNSVTSIGESTFKDCTRLTSVTIPNSVTSIGSYTFYHCYGLTSVTIPNSVTGIGSYAFYYCSGLTSVTIGNSVTSIGSNAFENCLGLKKVIVEDLAAWCGITFGNYNSNPLYYAEHLYSDEDTEITELVIPDGVMSIGSYTFRDCRGLTSVTIPSSMTSIGSYAFSGCSGLTSITIPSSVTSISSYAFNGCTNLATIVSLIEEPFKISNDTFSQLIYDNGTLYVPQGTVDKYKATDGWKKFVWMEEGASTGISHPHGGSDSATEMLRYTLDGRNVTNPQHGINIIKMSDGTTKKVFIK